MSKLSDVYEEAMKSHHNLTGDNASEVELHIEEGKIVMDADLKYLEIALRAAELMVIHRDSDR